MRTRRLLATIPLVAALLLPAGAATAADQVTVNGQTRTLTGTDVRRTTNALVLYTKGGQTTGTNQYGAEASVVDGKVTAIQPNGPGNMRIPVGGYVLSGHGTSKTWLVANAKVGATVILPGAPPPPPPPPPADTTAPTADLVLNPATGKAPFNMTADGSGSRDNVAVTSYAFSWGDGTPDSGPDYAPTASHTYATPGTYTVTLTVKDAAGNTTTTTKTATATVDDPQPVDTPPVARITATPASGEGPLTVLLDAGGSRDDLGIDGYAFDFGDGNRTASQPSSSVSHVYQSAGTFTAKVTVTDTKGQTSEASTTVTVTQTPPPPPPPTRSTTVSFTFDDSFSNQAAALDVLKQHGMRGTVYVNSPRIGTANYFTRAQLQAFEADGHEIAGHTLTHADLATLTSAEARRQVCDDRANLMAMGFKVKNFAYPFGSTTSTVQGIVRDCGYNSARGVGDLRSPGYGCTRCITADTIPPIDVWDIKTNQSVQSDTTVDMLKTYVTQAEADRGGWVPLVFHSICNGCASNSISLANFTTFVQWLADDQLSQVRTVDQVIGGALQPSPSTTTPPPPPPPPPAGSVTIGGSTRALTGTDIYRSTDSLVRYTPSKGATTGTNAYGAEVAVVGGVVTKVENGIGNMAIPPNGYVLSGHGTSRTWLLTYAKLNSSVTLN